MKRICLAFLFLLYGAWAQSPEPDFSNLSEGQVINGFRASAVYLDDAGKPMGARFRQVRSGFTLDLLRIQSVPQGFVWVTTYPTSNMGEPHTQEHLLLGKGNRGRALASLEPMELVESSAFTSQWTTCFHFYTNAGPQVFFEEFEHTFEALIHPDYTDEEIRREVRNFGVSTAADGSLRLEEKGTVYNEMVTSMDQPNSRLFHAASVAAYGVEHPLSYNSGGSPEALRRIQPSDIRKFHAQHYFGGNMGMIAALPKEVPLAVALAKIDDALDRVEPRPPVLPIVTENQLPKPQPAPPGRIEYVSYPARNQQQPSSALLLWPAERKLDDRDFELLSMFLDNIGGDSDTNLYNLLVDSRTRAADFGIQSVSAFADTDQGNPVYVFFRGLTAAHRNDRDLAAIRAQVMAELERIAAYPDGSSELAAFNKRFQSRILERRRQLAKFVNSPPRFGYRGTGPEWFTELYRLNKEGGFRKSLTEKPELDEIETLVAEKRNIWRDYLRQWKLIGVEPWIEVAKPDAGLVKQEEDERAERAAAETARLKQQYSAATGQAALRRYQADYDAATRVIDAAAKQVTPPTFLEHPPLTLDDSLQFESHMLPGGERLVTSTFESMSGATAGIDLRLDTVAEDRLVYLSMLPQLLTRVGVIENGKPVSYEEMSERLRDEILSLDARFSINPLTGRYELQLTGAGNNLAESQRAIEWMKLALFHPDWRMENLPRIRDLVEQTLSGLRDTMQRAEEGWVNDPARAVKWQQNPLLLATSSFMTREHNLLRLRWMLMGDSSPEIDQFLAKLAGASGTRTERQAILAEVEGGKYSGMASLSEPSRKLAIAAARDLEAALSEIPDSSLAADWTDVVNGMRRDLNLGPAQALSALEQVRQSLLDAAEARLSLIASPAAKDNLTARLVGLTAMLYGGAGKPARYRAIRHIDERLRERDPQATHPVFLGLVNANSQGGVFLNSAPGASYRETNTSALLDYVASNLYAGHGAHGIFMKTWAAGLAYSNGIRVRPLDGRLNYYAERTPLLPQTLEFVINEVKKAKPDASLVDYAIAGAFEDIRSALPYEERGEAMAADLADGLTPEVVRRFHQAILDLRKRPNLSAELFRRMPAVYAKVLPGMSVPARDVEGGVFLVIGPEKQLTAYEEYLKKTQGPDTMLYRLYPRDFWLE